MQGLLQGQLIHINFTTKIGKTYIIQKNYTLKNTNTLASKRNFSFSSFNLCFSSRLNFCYQNTNHKIHFTGKDCKYTYVQWS